MKLKSLTGAVSLAALIGGTVIGPANAQTIYLGLSTDGGPISSIGHASAFTGYASGLLSFGVFNFVSGSGYGEANNAAGFTTNVLASITAKQSKSNTLDVYFTEQGLTGTVAPESFVSGLTANGLSSGWSVTETIYVDPANGLYTTVTPIASQFFTPSSANSANFTDLVSGLSSYSVTEVYTITSPAGKLSSGSANLTEVVATAVPEASTWAMMIAGFAGLGLVGFGRSKKARAIEA